MKASELRIGNLCHYHVVDKLYDPPEYDVVNTIDYDDIRILYEYEDGGFKPIPLTEEWLLRFGFEKQRDGFWHKGRFFIEWLFNKPNLRITINSAESAHANSVEYVHQLQNLYFALTGEELTMKKEWP